MLFCIQGSQFLQVRLEFAFMFVRLSERFVEYICVESLIHTTSLLLIVSVSCVVNWKFMQA